MLFAQQQRKFQACSQVVSTYGDSSFQVQVSQFQSSKAKGRSLLILPPTGGTNVLDLSYAKNLCENGFEVIILEHWTEDDEYSLELEIHQRFYARAQKAISIVLAHIKTPFVGVLGTSVGAIHSAIAMGTQERIDAAFVIVGGAPVANVIAYSDQEILVEARKKRFEVYKFNDNQEYAKELDQILSLDPGKLPTHYRNKFLGMVISKEDTTVPVGTQRALRDLWKPQVVYEFSNNHFISIIKTWLFHKDDIVEFFNKAAASPGSSNERREIRIETKIFDFFGAHSNNEVFWQGTGKRINTAGKNLQVKCFATIGDGSFSTGEKHRFQLNSEKYLLSSDSKPVPQYLGDDVTVPTYSSMYKEYLKSYSLVVNENATGISVVRKFGRLGTEVLKFSLAKDSFGKLAILVSHKKGFLGGRSSDQFYKLHHEFSCQAMSPISKDEYVKGLNQIAK